MENQNTAIHIDIEEPTIEKSSDPTSKLNSLSL